MENFYHERIESEDEIDYNFFDASQNEEINTYHEIYVHKNSSKYVSHNEIEKISVEEFLRIIVQENFSSDDNIDRHTRLNKISLIEKNERVIIPLIHSLVKNSFSNLEEKIKISISIYLKNVFEKFIVNATITISNFENLSEILLILLKQLHSSDISCKVKLHLKQAIKNLTLVMCKDNFKDHSKNLFEKIFKEICNELESNKNKYLNFDSLQNFCDIYEIILMTRKEFIYDNCEFEQSLFVFDFILRNIHDLKFSDCENLPGLKKDAEDLEYENDELNPTETEYVKKNIKICEIFVQILTQILQNNSSTLVGIKLNMAQSVLDLNSDILFLNNKKFLQLINLIFYLDNYSLKTNFHFLSNDDLNYNNILPLDSNSKLKIKISNLKNNLLVSLTNCVIISTQKTDVNSSNLNCPLFVDFCYNLTGDILKSFKAFNTYFNISLIKDVNYENIDINLYINSCIMFLVECLNLNTAVELFRSNWIEIFRYVLMPMLRVSLVEKEAFIIDHEEYTKIIYDFTYSFKSNQIKSQGLNLLVSMCNVLEDFTKFVGNFYIEILIHLMQKDNSGSVDNSQCSANYSFKYLDPDVSRYDHTQIDSKTLFMDYVNLALTEEDLLEQSLQVLATIQECLYNSNRCEYYAIQAKFLNVFRFFLIKISLSDFIKSKLCLYCFAFLRFAFKLTVREENVSNTDIDLLSLTDSNFYVILSYLSENLFNESKANISLRFLILQFLNDLLFDKEFINCSKLKCFLQKFIQIFIAKKLNLFIQLENNSDDLSLQLNFFMMNLIKYYYDEIEDVIFPIFQNFLNKVAKEIDKYYKSISMQKCEKASKKSYKVSYKISDFIHYIHLITKNSDNSKNLTMGKNIFNANFEILLLNSAKIFNFIYEEDILKICQLTIPKITQFNSKLEKCFLEEYFTVIKYFEYNLKDYHIDFLISITKLVISSVNNITLSGSYTQEGLLSGYKERALMLLSEGFNHVNNTNDKIATTAVVCYLERDFHLASYMLAIACLLGNTPPRTTLRLLSFTDCLWIIEIICRRVMINKNKIYLGPLASRIFLAFHTVIIYLLDNFENEFFEYFIKNKNENFECLIKENFSICGDHYSEIENRISVIYSIRLLQIILKSCSTRMSVDQFVFIKEQIIFAIQQLAYITFKNYHQLKKEEKEFDEFKLKRNKKDFGLDVKNKEKFEEFSENSLCEENNFLMNEEVICENLDSEYPQEDFDLNITNEYIEEKDNSNEDTEEDELFMLDLTNEKELEMFNLKMTAELFLKRKRLEYSVRNYREDQIDSSKILEFLEQFSSNYDDEFFLFFQFLDKLKAINEAQFTQLFVALPKYIIEICSILRSWKRVDISKSCNKCSRARKIIKLKRSVD